VAEGDQEDEETGVSVVNDVARIGGGAGASEDREDSVGEEGLGVKLLMAKPDIMCVREFGERSLSTR
jgi:hypothetical protein